ncbi:peptide IlvX [Enterobacter hormaechei]|nr:MULTISPECIES: peptide IlvX [Enterobacter cloacae complex]MED5649279.1 peptide IlvX [Enterobacter hormaechei]HDR2466743.1 hypothetical protein [Enterobacter roggenkampii]
MTSSTKFCFSRFMTGK